MKNITEEQFKNYKQNFIETLKGIVETIQTSATFEDFNTNVENDNRHSNKDLNYIAELRSYFSDQIWITEDSIFDQAAEAIN
jgi:hypothetical protein